MNRAVTPFVARLAPFAGAILLAAATLAQGAALPQPQVTPDKGRVGIGLAPGWSNLYGGYRSATGDHKVVTEAGAPAPDGVSSAIDYGTFTLHRIGQQALTAQKLPAAAVRDQYNVVALRVGAIDTTLPQAQALRTAAVKDGKGLHLVQFAGPVKPEWVKGLEATGVRIVTAIPHNAYLVYGTAAALGGMVAQVRTQAQVQWDAPYEPAWRIDTALPVDGEVEVTVQLVDDLTENAATKAMLASMLAAGATAREWRSAGYVNLTAKVRAQAIDALAQRPEVVFIERFVAPQKADELQNMIVIGNVAGNVAAPGNWLTWLAGKGFTQAQFDASLITVDVGDSGIDNGTVTPNHFGLRSLGAPVGTSRVRYIQPLGTPGPSAARGVDGHGNLNSHIVAGYVPDGAPFNAFPHADAQGFRYGMGVAPFARVGSSVIFDPNFTGIVPSDHTSRAFNNGARLTTNSWGASVAGAYDSFSQAYDALVRDAQPTGSVFPVAGNQELVVFFSAGNDGPGANTIGSPGTAKNVVTVGATEGPRPFGAPDQCGIGDAGSDSFNDIIGFSSRGPADDGRVKPDIVAPGTHVTGGVWQAAVVNPVSGTGLAGALYDGSGVCGGIGVAPGSRFYPPSQQWYTSSSGTSHSTPMVAGGGALVRQWFINKGLAVPSPAMTRGFLMNSTRYLTGASANDTLPSNAQGMGSMDLERAFGARPLLLRDQVAGDRFTATGQSRTFIAVVQDSLEPLRVTLTWTDAPGPTSGNAYLNDLDLEVVVLGDVYRGNNFFGASSVPGGVPDFRNNAESVFVPNVAPGTPVLIRVKATNVVADGVPNNADALDQDFALVVGNAYAAAAPVLQVISAPILAESYSPANNFADPYETVDFAPTIRNVGTANAVNVVADVVAGPTVPLSGAASYGTLAAGAQAARSFTVQTPSLSCAVAPVVLELGVDGASAGTAVVNLSDLATLPVVTAASQNFDGVTPPALPAGWTQATLAGAPTLPFRTVAGGDVANGAQGTPASVVSDQVLVSPGIALPAGVPAQLTFRHEYNLEPGFDGAVLEIAIPGVAAGAFQDILVAGGSFVSGGYDRTISASFGSPIAGRQAWSANSSAAFATVQVNLPVAAQGQTVQLRWRLASDSSVVAILGYVLDTVAVTVTTCETPLVSVAPASFAFAPTRVGQNSAAQAFTITNATAATVNLAQALAGTDVASFGITVPACASLAGGANCATGARANPVAPIGDKTARMALTATQGPKTQLINVPLAVLAQAPVQTLLPATATLTSPSIGAASGAITFALSNNGNVAMAIGSISVGGAGFARSGGTCAAAFPAALAAGATCTVLVTYTAPSAVPSAGTLTVVSDALGSPQTATLNGVVGGGAARVFVSPEGNDANPCTSGAQCRTLQAGVNAAAVGGEVVLSGSGGYGNAAINKSLTVIAAKGTYAALSFTGIEDGLTIGAPNTVVVLRNVAINGSAGGTHGVRVLPTATGSVLHLENVTISNMAGSGLRVEAAASVFVLNSSFRSNLGPQAAVAVGAGGATLNVSRTRFEQGGSDGISISGGRLMLRQSMVTENVGHGVMVSGAIAPAFALVENGPVARNLGDGVNVDGATAQAVVRRATLSGNLGAGLRVTAGQALADRTQMHGNRWGMVNSGGTITSMGNNPTAGNPDGNVGAITVVPRQ